MFNSSWVEWIGYAGALIITISLMMTSIIKLRMINAAGCVLFVIYGLAVGLYPVVGISLVMTGINLYHLYKLNNEFRI